MLFAQYRQTIAMLHDSARRYQEAQAVVVQTTAELAALGVEKERLLRAIETAVAEEVGGAVVVGVMPERAGERVSVAVVASEDVDLG